MENPSTWDEHDKAMMAILDAHRESEQQGVIGLSLHRKLGDYVRAALAEYEQHECGDTPDYGDKLRTAREQVTQQAETIQKQYSLLRNSARLIEELGAAEVALAAEARDKLKQENHEFENFHSNLCKRFGYSHDPIDWKRDQVSLEESIARQIAQQATEITRLEAALQKALRVVDESEGQQV